MINGVDLSTFVNNLSMDINDKTKKNSTKYDDYSLLNSNSLVNYRPDIPNCGNSMYKTGSALVSTITDLLFDEPNCNNNDTTINPMSAPKRSFNKQISITEEITKCSGGDLFHFMNSDTSMCDESAESGFDETSPVHASKRKITADFNDDQALNNDKRPRRSIDRQMSFIRKELQQFSAVDTTTENMEEGNTMRFHHDKNQHQINHINPTLCEHNALFSITDEPDVTFPEELNFLDGIDFDNFMNDAISDQENFENGLNNITHDEGMIDEIDSNINSDKSDEIIDNICSNITSGKPEVELENVSSLVMTADKPPNNYEPPKIVFKGKVS